MQRPTSLTRPTLVLNATWVPIRTVNVRRALHLMATGAAKGLDATSYELTEFHVWITREPDADELCIRTVSLRIRVPELIVLSGYSGVPNQLAPFSRRNLYRRDRGTCQYCGSRPGHSDLSIDHVVPRSQGGRTDWRNCVLSCQRCNRKKRNRTPLQASMRLLTHPEAPRWSPMFELAGEELLPSWSRFLAHPRAAAS
jgi:5-methylcytosine-specific restriction endonuclease McrA